MATHTKRMQGQRKEEREKGGTDVMAVALSGYPRHTVASMLGSDAKLCMR